MKLSVITVVKNADKFIERTIRSVLYQNYSNIEYIVIDGLSDDKTMEIVNRYSKKIDIIVSQEDDGIYDAMNKSLKFATGDVINFLNAGDTYIHSNVIEIVMNNYNNNILIGNARLTNNYHKYKRNIFGFIKKMKYRKVGVSKFCHQCVFYNPELHAKYGEYEHNKYDFVADRHFFSKVKDKSKFSHIDYDIVNYLQAGTSINNVIKRLEEDRDMHYKITKNYILSSFIFYTKKLYYSINKL